jgi:hypothetical protein
VTAAFDIAWFSGDQLKQEVETLVQTELGTAAQHREEKSYIDTTLKSIGDAPLFSELESVRERADTGKLYVFGVPGLVKMFFF